MANDFLKSAGDMASGFADAFMGRAGTELGDALFGPSDRIPHERFIENETRMDWHNLNNVERQNAFLAGTMPTNAAMYNQYADATYTEDTRRLAERAESLGMNPWDLTGTGAGSGGQNTQPMQPQTNPGKSEFLQATLPLQIAKINAQTQLATTKMQTDTQRAISGQQTADGKIALTTISEKEQGILESKAREALAHASKGLTLAQTEKTDIEATRTALGLALDVIREMVAMSPTLESKTPFGNVKGLANYPALMRLLDQTAATVDLRQLTDDELHQALREGADFTTGISKNLSSALDAASKAGEATGQFLQGVWEFGEDFMANKPWSEFRANPDRK